MWGAPMEMAYAVFKGFPVYIICLNGHQHHPFLTLHAEEIFTDFESFEEFLKNSLI